MTPTFSLRRFGSPLGLQLPKWELTWECGVHSLTLSYILGSMKCDSRASLLAHTFASPCLNHEPKARVTTFNFETLNFFGAKDHFKMHVMKQFCFLQNLALLVIKNHQEKHEDIVNLEKNENIYCQQTQESGEKRWAITIE